MNLLRKSSFRVDFDPGGYSEFAEPPLEGLDQNPEAIYRPILAGPQIAPKVPPFNSVGAVIEGTLI